MKQVLVGKCPAGSWLDVAVARELGHMVVHRPHLDEWLIASDNNALRFGINSGKFENVETGPQGVIKREYCLYLPKYSANITAAWELIEELIKNHEVYITNYYNHPDGWSANYRKKGANLDWKSIDAETAPLAITRAYLKAKGIEYVEVDE